MKLLSIVIPTYNMEKYLGNCLSSFIDETNELFSKLEILVVNDGSKDKSLQIAKGYESKYPKVFRVIDKENGGHGSTINKGIEEASGKYFRVVDSDDWVDTKNFYRFLKKLETVDTDIVFTPFCQVDEHTGRKKKIMYNTRGIQKEAPCTIDDFLNSRKIKMHTITYRTEILQENHIRLDEHCFYVDTEYVMFPLKYIQSCMLINDTVYMYRVNLSTQSCSNEGYFKHCKDHEKVTLHLLDFMNKSLGTEMSRSKEVYFRGFVLEMVEKQYRIYLMDKPFSSHNHKEIIAFDQKVKRMNRNIYQKTKRKAYVNELRKKKFRFYVLQKIKFDFLRKSGKYQGLDF